MRIEAERVAVDGPRGPLLPATSLGVSPGQVALVRGEPGSGHTALGLALTGRLRPSAGTVTVGGRTDAGALRALSALVDAPGVTEPDGNLRLADVVAEELALAGGRASRRRARAWLTDRRADRHARDRLDDLPPAMRIRLLTELAAARPGNRLLVLHSPDRHTGNTEAWWPLALRHAERGHAVVVLSSTSSARLLAVRPARLGQLEQPAPLTVGEP
ncbi:ABC transporter ATP-binding protein [Actinophytocola sp.]|uniref:ABC transporter ATP-binding protein n=1 Tax=Actinophytocola sp. TaxID=1872138 RepID=UPI002D7F9E5D|nr:ABC transporter ATP-binding protein [Actinophytocola sp.]HET9139750.1 ABC transporter ATP-binding protein [Actinophytocola sp.]